MSSHVVAPNFTIRTRHVAPYIGTTYADSRDFEAHVIVDVEGRAPVWGSVVLRLRAIGDRATWDHEGTSRELRELLDVMPTTELRAAMLAAIVDAAACAATRYYRETK